MSDCQSISRRVPGVRYSVKRVSDIGSKYPADMNKSRTEYGARLYAARKHAKLTQTAIAKLVGMSQSGYAEAETTGLTSTYTAQLAAACGISAQWLATGEGSMLSDGANPKPEMEQLAAALGVLTKALQKADKNTRLALEPLLSSMAKEPEDAAQKSQLILRLLVTDHQADEAAHHHHPTAKRSGVLIGGSAFRQLGETDGDSYRHASKKATKG
jgi:transcriptional regulator with XRE-family HTH domain